MQLAVTHTEHGLSGQPEAGHGDCNLLVVMVTGHILFLLGLLGEAEHGPSQHLLHILLFLYLEGE